VARDPQLRRLQMSFIGFAFAEHATWLAILVYAYDRGGVAESGLMAMIQLLPAMVVAPFAAYAGDRFRVERVLSLGYAIQAVSMTATACAMWANQPVLSYVAATVAASSITFSRPVMGAVLPAMTRTPSDLVAANVVTGFIEYVGMFLGPLIGGLLLVTGSPALVFAVCGAATANSALLSLGLRLEASAPLVTTMRAGDVIAAVWDGLRALGTHAALRSLIMLMAVGGLVRGVADVLMVLFAEDRLNSGGGAAGLLGVGMGIGAVIGSVATAGLIGRARIAMYLFVSGVVFGVGFVVLSGADLLVLGMVMFALFGVGESLLRVTAAVGVQRLAPDAFLARIFGVAEGLQMAAMAFGSLAVSLVVRAIGLGAGLVAIGAAVTIAMTWTTARFRHAGGDVPPPAAELIDRLLADDLFRHLPGPALTRLARTVHVEHQPDGTVLITEGEMGDRYYLIMSGEVTVTAGGAFVRTMGSGHAFGEIALLRDSLRTATVACATPAALLVVERDDFLGAITGHPRTMAAAHDVASRFLTG
jgi:hypothetical protein